MGVQTVGHNRTTHTHTHTERERNESQIHATVWMNLKDIVPGEIIQTQRTKLGHFL